MICPAPAESRPFTAEAKTWLVNLACRKAKELGYPHELWTTRLLARYAREHGPEEGHSCLSKLAQGTLVQHPKTSRRSSRTRSVIAWSAVTPNLTPRWRKFCASIAR